MSRKITDSKIPRISVNKRTINKNKETISPTKRRKIGDDNTEAQAAAASTNTYEETSKVVTMQTSHIALTPSSILVTTAPQTPTTLITPTTSNIPILSSKRLESAKMISVAAHEVRPAETTAEITIQTTRQPNVADNKRKELMPNFETIIEENTNNYIIERLNNIDEKINMLIKTCIKIYEKLNNPIKKQR